MKNKIIIALVFILPFLVYGSIQAFKSNENRKNIALASESAGSKLIIYKFYSPMCKDCTIQTREFEKIKPKLTNEVFVEEINVSENSDKNQKLIEEYNILVVPSTVFVDNSGRIKKKSSSILNSDELMQEISRLLKEI